MGESESNGFGCSYDAVDVRRASRCLTLFYKLGSSECVDVMTFVSAVVVA